MGDAMFPPAAQIIAASCDADRAALILRLPDAIVSDHLTALCDACASTGFTVGAAYLTARAVSFSSVRRLDGSLALDMLSQIEDLRHAVMVVAFSEAVQPHKVSSPTGRTRHASRAARPAASFPGGGMTDRFPARAPERAPENPGGFPVEMTEIGPQYVIPGCERPAAPKTNGGATHD